MKYFAILKDSLREALDSKVLYVLLGLSLLIVSFVATLGFRPMPAERTFEKLLDGTMVHYMEANKPDRNEKRKARNDLPQLRGGLYQLKKVETVDGKPDSPDANYRLVLNKMYMNEDAAAKVRRNPDAEFHALHQHFADLEQLGFFRIGAIRLAPVADPKPFDVEYQLDFLSTSGTRRIWLHEPSLFFGLVPLSEIDVPLGFQLSQIADLVLSMGSWVAVLLGVIITSFFIPNMLQKGTIDLLLVKPIRRSLLLFFKYIGGLTFIFLNNAFAILGIWLVLGLRSGIWANWVLLLIPIMTFFFAILYAVSTLTAVLTRSTVTAILVTIGAWFMFFLVGLGVRIFETGALIEEALQKPEAERRFTNNAFRTSLEAVHRCLPRTSDLNDLTHLLVFSDFMTGGYLAPERVLTGERNWWESFGVSMAFIAIMLGLACWRFARKDY